MAKNKNKKNRKSCSAMEISNDASSDYPHQAMDTSEAIPSKPLLGITKRTIIKKNARIPKRSINIRKQKATERAISKGEKMEEKARKIKHKLLRIQSAKSLYD